jgi:glutathione S-transferase
MGNVRPAMNEASGRDVQLYELVLDNGRSASPYVWRSRYALAHKGIEYTSVPLGFTEIPTVFGGRFRTVPVLRDGEHMLAESWDIAEYLERTRPQGAALFGGASELATTKLLDAWLHAEILRRLFRLYALDIHDAARPQDRPYFRQSREKRLQGRSLEEFTAGREQQLPATRAAFAPLRAHLAQYPFLGGASPNYADYMVLAILQWVASVSTLPLLGAEDEMLRAWFNRSLDLYGGLGRDARMRPLFE